MGVTSGFSEYVCEGCDEHAMIKDDDNTAKNKWQEIERVTADGQHIKRMLCERCRKAYSPFAVEQDAAFNAFMVGRRNA